MSKLFVLPKIDAFLEGYEISDKVVVVSIIGKSTLNANGLKVKSIGRNFSSNKNRNSECTIEGFFDEEKQVIYLHVHTLLDSDAFLEHYAEISQRCKEIHDNDDFLVIYNEVKSRFARAVLFVFYTSHIVILSHIGHSFDLNYIQYFKAVESLRHKLLDDIQEDLENIGGLSKEWIKTGRMCTPRLIFYFEKCPKNVTNIKKLEHNIEDQIYQILKKTRIISNNSTSALFTIPPNDEFAYVNNDSELVVGTTDTPSLALTVRSLMGGCEPGAGGVRVPTPFCDSSATRSFRRFLRTHIRQAHSDRGFEDAVIVGGHGNSHRHGHGHGQGNAVVQPHFELPTLGHWAAVAKVLYGSCITAETVKSLCTDTQFSQQRCLKVLPIAFSKYQEGLPSHYGESIHKARLAHALSVFGAQARGPMYAQYENRLIADCVAYWAAGVRQACESPSLSGLGCELPRHASDVPHCSGSRRVAACDCGRMQATREDPYTAKQANYTFYHQLSKECTCFSLERIHFPIFQPSGLEYGPADLSQYQMSSAPAPSTPSKQNLKNQDDQQIDISDNTTKDDIEGSRKKHEDKVVAGDGSYAGKINFSATDSEAGSLDKVKGSRNKEGVSSTEYLLGMYTLMSPSHLLPTFSSWSLVCLGPSSIYSHNQGLPDTQQPGFLSTTNYLLPWDKQVQLKQPRNNQQQQLLFGVEDSNSTTVLLTGGRKKVVKGGRDSAGGGGGTSGAGGGRSHFTVKVFIGVEYECPKGHRFMLAGPDRILRAAPGILVTDTAHRLVNSDMPLFHPCPCRSSLVPPPVSSNGTAPPSTHIPLIAQLIRLHVVTPKAPVTVILSPKVQPAVGAPTFLPPGPTELKLTQSTYWVLRLPYMFVDERERPVLSDPVHGRMLKGVFAVRKDHS